MNGIAVRHGGRQLRLQQLLLMLEDLVVVENEITEPIEGRLSRLNEILEVIAVSRTGYAELKSIVHMLGVSLTIAPRSAEKLGVLHSQHFGDTIVIGQSYGDAALLGAADLGIAVVGSGASGAAISNADLVCATLPEALDLLLDERALGRRLAI